MSTLPVLVLRGDASPRMGSGHIMRLLALAQAWRDRGGKAFLLASSLPGVLRERFRREGVSIQDIEGQPASTADANQTASCAMRAGATWVVLDGYHFGDEFQRAIKARSSVKIFALDDYGHASHQWADVVLNQNAYAQRDLYRSAAGDTRLLLGTQYILLRRGFWAWRERQTQRSPTVHKILLTMGGGDAAGATNLVLPALIHACPPACEVQVAMGGGTSPTLSDLVASLDGPGPSVHVDRDVQNMAEVLRKADLAVAAAGITAWELAFMGVPSLLVAVAENQKRVAAALEGARAARYLGPVDGLGQAAITEEVRALIVDGQRRSEMSERGKRLVDGYGVDRVVSILNGTEIWLRPARLEDREILWRWANEPVTRKNSFRSEPISWETHVRWFEDHITRNRSLCYLAFTPGGQPVGQARFDETPQGAAISVSVASEMRGRGYGTKLIRESVRLAMKQRPYPHITAYIKEENTASIRAFRGAGFHSPAVCSVRGSRALALRMDRGDLAQL